MELDEIGVAEEHATKKRLAIGQSGFSVEIKGRAEGLAVVGLAASPQGESGQEYDGVPASE